MFSRLRPYLIAIILIGTACGLRWPGLEKKVWNLDEGSTFTMAEIVKHGGVMYHDATDNRTPLVPYAKALFFWVAGDWNIRGAHIALAVMLGLTAVWLWRLGVSATDSTAGVFAALFFTLLSFVMLGPDDAMAAHTGWFLVFFSALGMWAFATALARESLRLALAAGVAFAAASLAKQPGLLDYGVCLVLCVVTACSRPGSVRLCLRLAVAMTAGFVAALALTYWYFKAHGAWDDFLQYSWYYNTRLYVPEVPFHERLLGIKTPLQLAQDNARFCFWLGCVGLVWLLIRALPDLWKRPKSFAVLPWLALGWLASGLVSTVLSGRPFPHYSIQVLPGFSLVCGWTAARLWEKSGTWRENLGVAIKWLLRGAVALILVGLLWKSIQRASTFDLSDGISRDIGLIVKARTKPTDKIFVWGYEPELHVFAERLPNTRFVYSVFLTGLIPWTNLDALKDTAYAVVPGAWEAFWHDFAAQPPAVIVDTHGNRGFLKYPLREQTRLWEIVERDYVEVAVDYATARGYSVYQRKASADPGEKLPAAPIDQAVHLTAPAQHDNTSLPIRIDAPDGTDAIELYVDDHLYRRLPNSTGQAVQTRFYIRPEDLPIGNHKFQAVAQGKSERLSPPHLVAITPKSMVTPHFNGPPLTFAGKEFMPIESVTIGGEPVSLYPESGQWVAHAPSKLVYLRPDGLTQVNFTFGITPGAYDGSNPQKTDGVDVTVFFEEKSGKPVQLYRRHLDPVANAADRTLMSGHARLPGLSGGKIIFRMTPGPMNNPAFDWSYWRQIEGDTPGFTLDFRGGRIGPVELEAALGMTTMSYRNHQVQLIHAPSRVAFKQLPGMTEISGEFGLLAEAWQGPQQSNGAIFEIEQVLPDGTHRSLFKRSLFPANKPEDREIQSLHASIPYAENSLIRLTTSPANPANNAYNYTFWSGLTIAEFIAHLRWDGKNIDSLHSAATNGFSYMDERGQEVLFAHAPSELEFPLPAAAKRIQGGIGLIHGSYTDKGQTDGATFVIEQQNAAGLRKEIFRRYLNPRDIPSERGTMPFSADVAGAKGDTLIFRTESAPSGKLNFAWSYWADLQLTP